MDCSALSMPLSHCALYNCWNSEKKKNIHSYTCSIYQPSAGLFTNEKPFPTAKLKLRWGKNCRLVLHIVFFFPVSDGVEIL